MPCGFTCRQQRGKSNRAVLKCDFCTCRSQTVVLPLSSTLQKSMSPAEGLDLLHCVTKKRTAGGLLSGFQQYTGLHVTQQTVRNRRYEGGMSSWHPLMGPVTRSTAGWFSSLPEGVKKSEEYVRCCLILWKLNLLHCLYKMCLIV